MKYMVRACATGAVVAILSACGGGGDSGDAVSDQGALGSPQKVAMRLAVGSLSEFFAPPATAKRRLAMEERDVPPPRDLSKDTVTCENGCAYDTTLVDVDMESPYSDETFRADRRDYEECGYPLTDGTQVLSGLDVFGCPVSDSTDYPCSDGNDPLVYAIQSGSVEAPFSILTTFTASSGATYETDTALTGYRFHLTRLRNADGIQGRNRTLSRSYSPSNGTVRVNGGPLKSYTRSAGRPGQPVLRVRTTEPQTASMLTLEGYNSLVGTGCNLGEYHLRTILPIQYIATDDCSISQVLSGKVEITQDGKSATAEIREDGSLLVTDSDGQTETFTSVEQVRAQLGGCLDFAAN